MFKVGQIVYSTTTLILDGDGAYIPIGTQGVVVGYEPPLRDVPACSWFPYEVHFRLFTQPSDPFLCRENELTR